MIEKTLVVSIPTILHGREIVALRNQANKLEKLLNLHVQFIYYNYRYDHRYDHSFFVTYIGFIEIYKKLIVND